VTRLHSGWNSRTLRALYQVDKPISAARIGNVFFLGRIGQTLKWATQDIAREELPPKIRRLLAQLERSEAKAALDQRARDAEPPG
jgi:hypothetical protein